MASLPNPEGITNTAKKLVGIRIKILRNIKRWSQEKLATSIGVSREWVLSTEKGETNSFDKIVLACAVLGVSSDAVLSQLEMDPEDFSAQHKFVSQFL